MRRSFLSGALLLLAVGAYAASQITGYVQINPPNSPQSGGFNTQSGTVGTFTDTGLPANQCVQTGPGGLLSTTGTQCGAGGGGPSGASLLQVTQSGVQITSPTASINFFGNDFKLQGIGSTSTVTLNPATTDFIQNTLSLQTGQFTLTGGNSITDSSGNGLTIGESGGLSSALTINQTGNNGSIGETINTTGGVGAFPNTYGLQINTAGQVTLKSYGVYSNATTTAGGTPVAGFFKAISNNGLTSVGLESHANGPGPNNGIFLDASGGTTNDAIVVANGGEKFGNLTASQYVETDSNSRLVSVNPFTTSNTWTAPQTFNGNVNFSSGVLLSGAAGLGGQVFTSQGAGAPAVWTTVSGGGGGSTVLLSSGIAFGSSTNTITADTTSLTWTDSSQQLTITSTQPWPGGISFSKPMLNLIGNAASGIKRYCLNLGDATSSTRNLICRDAANGNDFSFGTEGTPGGGYSTAMTITGNTLQANTFNTSSATITGSGNGNITLNISGSPFSVIGDSITSTVGYLPVFTSTNGTVGNAGPIVISSGSFGAFKAYDQAGVITKIQTNDAGVGEVGNESNHDLWFMSNNAARMTLSAAGTFTINTLAGGGTQCLHINNSGTISGTGADCGGGGGSTGGSIIASTQGNVAYYSAVGTNTLSGSNFLQIGTSSVTVKSSMTVSDFPSANTSALLDVFKNSSITDTILFAAGSTANSNQFLIRNQDTVSMSASGANIGNLQIGGRSDGDAVGDPYSLTEIPNTSGTQGVKMYDTSGNLDIGTSRTGSGGTNGSINFNIAGAGLGNGSGTNEVVISSLGVTVTTITNITIASGVQSSLAGVLNLTTTNSAWNEPGIYYNATANTSNNNSDILVDDGFTPAITIRETSQTNPSAKKWQYSAHNGVLRYENRLNDDSGFGPYMQVSSATFWNDMYVGSVYGNQNNNTQFQIQSSTGNVYITNQSTAGTGGYRVDVSTIGHFNVVNSSTSFGPTITNGTGDTSCSDTACTITATNSPVTFTFTKAYTKVPVCVYSERTGSVVNAASYTLTATAFTLTQTGLGGDTIDLICVGRD